VMAPVLDQLDVTAAIEQIADRPDVGLPDYAALIGPRCRAVWLLTAGGERVHSDEADVRPAQAALAAMHRSVGFEFPDQNFGSLDLPSRDVDAPTAAAVVDVLRGDPTVTALRANGRRHVRTFRECSDSAAKRPLDTATLENVVITGGSGAIGLRYAQHCVEQGARRVVLLSRNGVDPVVLGQLAERHGAEVHAPLCDIADRDAVSDVAIRYAGSGASLLIHAAGIGMARQHSELTGADVAAVCAAKVVGLALMADVWPLQPECRILACSSLSGVWGGHGHAPYAASNRLLDVLAAQLRVRKLDCTSIRWGLWRDAGVIEGGQITRTQRSGLIAMDPNAAVDASLGLYREDPLIFAADFDRLGVFFQSQGTATPFSVSPDSDGAPGVNGLEVRPLAEVVVVCAIGVSGGDGYCGDGILCGATLFFCPWSSCLSWQLHAEGERLDGSTAIGSLELELDIATLPIPKCANSCGLQSFPSTRAGLRAANVCRAVPRRWTIASADAASRVPAR